MFKRFLKTATAGVLVAVMGVALAVPVQASNLNDRIRGTDSLLNNVGSDTYGGDTTGAKDSLTKVIVRLINFALSLIGIIFLILVIYAGFLWMTAGGNEDQVDKAKKLIINSVIGILVIVAAYAFTNFVLDEILQAFA